MLSRSWQKIDLPSCAHSGAPNASGFKSAFFTSRKPEPSAFTKPRCHAWSDIIENASCFPSGDQTGPKQLSLGMFGTTVNFAAGDIGNGNVTLGTRAILRVAFSVKCDAFAVRRNLWPIAFCDFL